MRTIDTAIAGKDCATLERVFGAGYNNTGGSTAPSWQSVGQGEQRSIAAHFIVRAVQDPNGFLPHAFAPPGMIEVFQTALSHLPVTVEQAADNRLRMALFEYLVQEGGEYALAARILAGTRMEDNHDSVYKMSAAEKTNIHVSVAECFLMEDEISESDAAVNKAGVTVEQIENKQQHSGLILRYKSTYARVLDANRKFLPAASRYHELSTQPPGLIAKEELYHMLGRAATCAILAPSGPQRQRVLGYIANDPRLSQLDALEEFATHALIVKKMHTHQILRPGSVELTAFEASLAPHQKAIMGDGLSIMERGVVEHNMIAVSYLYESIYVTELAYILGVSKAKAESIAAGMIMDGSLLCTIDLGVGGGLLEFQDDVSAMEAYDRSVSNFCHQLNAVADAIKAKQQ